MIKQILIWIIYMLLPTRKDGYGLCATYEPVD